MINFNPGPSQLYFTVQDHVRKAFKEGIPSISHRSKQFEKIFSEATENLRTLLSIPSNFQIYFAASATELWERVLQNLVGTHSTHLVNGAFSKRFYETALLLNKKPNLIKADDGKSFDGKITVDKETELIAITHNETSTGVSVSINLIDNLAKENPQALVAVDAVSSLPYPSFNFHNVDSVFFSVQKGFGLPAGLGVWIVNEKCHVKAEKLLSSGISIGSYHNLKSYQEFGKKNQTPETPNVLYIYLLARVAADMLERGIINIRRETEYKAAILYHLLAKHPLMKPFVKAKEDQSKTVIVADCGDHMQKINQALQAKGMTPGDGYGAFKSNHLRFANFPTHSKEQFELLVDTLEGLV
jgi:phosphoserine aminotransferase